ncbi:MAG: PulJ/GspJ family protein [Longimicrobiales bacterium]
MRPRAGMTLVECLVAFALSGLVSAAVASVLMTQGRLVRAMTELAADTDARRITAAVLRAELRWIAPATDVRAIAGDSIAVRLYRGTGSVCGVVADRLLVYYAGARLPAPDKDSVLVRSREGESVHDLVGVENGAACDGRPAVWLRIDGAAPAAAAAVLVFESGTYFVREGAFRYRLGAAGRQPITDERFATTSPPVRLGADPGAALIPIGWPAATGRSPDSVSIHFANVPR